jgi:tRNA(Arg) A34 adenosine deaminase TadA
MCAGALIYAKVGRIVYGATMGDIDPENKRIRVTIESLVENKINPPIINQYMHQECIDSLYKRIS